MTPTEAIAKLKDPHFRLNAVWNGPVIQMPPATIDALLAVADAIEPLTWQSRVRVYGGKIAIPVVVFDRIQEAANALVEAVDRG